jgi:dCMP deaminase
MKEKLLKAYMKTAKIFAECSTAVRLKVGAIVVKDNRIISIGYNGMPSGWDNTCEDRIYPNELLDDYEQHSDEFDAMFPYADEYGKRYKLKTKQEVLHAERNALNKLACSHESGEGAYMFITHAPCLECAKSIYGSGIKEIYYNTEYRSIDGLKFLEKCGIKITKV